MKYVFGAEQLSVVNHVAVQTMMIFGVSVILGAIGLLGRWSSHLSASCGGILLVAAGLHQLMPLKDFCLSKCRTPLSS
jgi:predicted metal-binding membrane protein